MTKPDESNGRPGLLLDEALDWIVRLKANEPQDADLEALQHWRGQSPHHEESFKEAVRLWRNLGIAARELAAEKPEAGTLTKTALRVLRLAVRRRSLIGCALAATAAGLMIVYPPFGIWPSFAELTAGYWTGKGEQRSIELTNDVVVQMNTQTSLTVRSVPDATEIDFIAGEAAIRMQGTPGKPVRVVAAQGQMIASRANFHVRYIDGIVAVTCIDGTVDVMYGHTVTHLPAEQKISYSAAGLSPSVPVSADEATAWQLGILIFHDQPLAGVIDEVNRYRPGRIVILNAELGRRAVSGMFHVDRLDGFIGHIQQLLGAHVRSLPLGVALLS